VVGASWFSGDDEHGFLWDATNGMQDLGTLSRAKPSAAFGINNSGQVVGFSYTASGQAHAFLWQNGTMSDLNDLIPPGSGWDLGAAYAINNAGQIVGVGVHNGQGRAFLLTPDSSGLPAPAGTVQFTRSDAQAVQLADSTVTAADAGVHPISLTPGTLGDQTLTGTATAEATRIGRATVRWTSDAAAPAGGTVPNATDAFFVRSHRANSSVWASDWEVTELEPGVSRLPTL
jgi:probable HAF family extracellular repeat protein